MVSTDTKLDKLHSSITCFAVLNSFHVIPCCSFQEWSYCSWSKTLLVSWNFWKISEIPLLEIPTSLAISLRLIFLAIFTSLILFPLQIFAKILNVRIFTISKKKSVLFLKSICVLAVEYFSILKQCTLVYMRRPNISFPFIQNPCYKI